MVIVEKKSIETASKIPKTVKIVKKFIEVWKGVPDDDDAIDNEIEKKDDMIMEATYGIMTLGEKLREEKKKNLKNLDNK